MGHRHRQDQSNEAARRKRENQKIKRAAQQIESQTPTKGKEPAAPKLSRKLLVSLRKRFLPLFLGAMTIIGGASVLYGLRPKIQIAQYGSLDSSDPFEAQFTVTNSGIFDIKDVDTVCVINHVQTANYTDISGLGARDANTGHFAVIAAQDVATIPCSFKNAFHFPGVTHADITINVYALPLWWRRLRRHARFVAHWGKNGTVLWTQEPVRHT
ncbi:MAG: hypothetical protein ACJ74Z_00500 [Bryobacteraceae bacterium]